MAPRPRSLFDPHDIPAFSKKLVQALQDTDLRASARDWQRDYIHEFDVPVVGKRIVSLYQDALALHKHRS